MSTKNKGSLVKGACGCKADEFEYQDAMSGYWYLQHRKSCPLRMRYEKGKGEARAAGHPRPTGLTAEERDDLQTERELLVDMIETIDLLLVHLKHGIQFHRNTGIMKRGITDLEFARMKGMVAKGTGKGRRGSHPYRVSRMGNGI